MCNSVYVCELCEWSPVNKTTSFQYIMPVKTINFTTEKQKPLEFPSNSTHYLFYLFYTKSNRQNNETKRRLACAQYVDERWIVTAVACASASARPRYNDQDTADLQSPHLVPTTAPHVIGARHGTSACNVLVHRPLPPQKITGRSSTKLSQRRQCTQSTTARRTCECLGVSTG